MAEADWAFISGSLDAAQVGRGVSSAFPRPNGGLNFTFGMHSLVATEGFTGLYCDLTNFNPLLNSSTPAAATGGSVRGALQKYDSSTPTEYAPLLFIGLRGGSAGSPAPTTLDTAYMLGLENASPYRIVLVKGTPGAGLPTAAVLRASSQSYTPGNWHHLRLDMIVNPTGDVILQAFYNDLTAHTVTAPTWAAIAGLTEFTDDALGVLSGSEPLSGGFIGYGMYSKAAGRLGLFDHIEAIRQV